jgi:transcriptional regulator of acetoin/glycerol metabolism
MKIIQGYHWPGNIRELENVIERAVVLAPPAGSLVLIEPEHLPKELETPVIGLRDEIGKKIDYRAMRDQSVGDVEKKLIIHYLQNAGGNVTRACALAGIPRRTFYRMMEKQGIRAKEVVK